MKLRRTCLALTLLALVCAPARGAELADSLKKGTPDIKSIGALAFGPEGILFVGDPQGAAIFAVGTGDTKGGKAAKPLEIPDVNEKVASQLGIESRQLRVNDLAVNPASGNAYLAVTRGAGADAAPVLLRIDRGTAKISEVSLKDVPFAKVTLTNAPAGERQRGQAITCMAFVKDKLFVAGLSNEEFASKLRAIPFPFKEANKGTSVEIYHGAHGAFETRSPVRTFVPFDIKGETNLLAAYTCTPLVKFPVGDLKPGKKIKGTTIAELGNRNRPLDMVVYEKGGKQYILMANSSRGVMKISTEGIDKIEGITEKVARGGTKGLPYDTIRELKGVQQLSKLDDKHALVLIRTGGGAINLQTIEMP